MLIGWRRPSPPRWLPHALCMPLVLDVVAGVVLAWDHPWLRCATGIAAGVGILLVAAGGAPRVSEGTS